MNRKIRVVRGSGNVFADLGYPPAEAEMLLAKSALISYITDTIRHRKYSLAQAARKCRTSQRTLSNVQRGRMMSVTLDDLLSWLVALGRTVEIHIKPYSAKAKTGQLRTVG